MQHDSDFCFAFLPEGNKISIKYNIQCKRYGNAETIDAHIYTLCAIALQKSRQKKIQASVQIHSLSLQLILQVVRACSE